MSTLFVELRGDQQCAVAIAERLGAWEEGGPPAASAYDLGGGNWAAAAYFQGDGNKEELTKRLVHLLDDLLDDKAKASLTLTALENKDWVTESQTGLRPIIAGRFTIHGSHDRLRLPRHTNRVEIDAGQAFGTAHHGTTLGCLMMIEQLVRRKKFSHILDLGTGSGILAISLAKIFKQPMITASDCDPVAIKVAQENAKTNNVSGFTTFVCADGLDHPQLRKAQQFDLLIANILAGPLMRLAPKIANTVMPGGDLILSGLSVRQAARISARYRSLGFILRNKLVLDDWATLNFARGL